MEKVYVSAQDGYRLELHVFALDSPKAIVQIIHGMEEHQERYEPFVQFLNQNGYAVVSSDMRGHGKGAKNLGYFKNKKGYLELIEDQKSITTYIQKRFMNIPIYLFAHSMGTIITRVLLQECSLNYHKVVLSGYPNYQRRAYMGIVLTALIRLFKGAKYKSRLVASLSVDAFNKQIQYAKTKCDWISYNEENIQSYMDDPYCGFGFTTSAYNDLFHLVVMMHQVKRYRWIHSDLKLLFLRGEDDPCVGGKKGAEDSRRILAKAGFNYLKYIDYPHMRHEILAEDKKQDVYNDILNFFDEEEK